MTEYGKQVAKKMDEYMDNPNSIDKEVNDIQNADFGVEVRGALASSVTKSFNKSKTSEQKADEAYEVMTDIIEEGFNSAALESKFEQRLNDEVNNLQPEWTGFKNDVTSQLADIAINIKMFGAVLDGITDDTEAFKKALIHLNSIGGGKLLIPNGIMLVMGGGNSLEDFSGLSIEDIHNITIEGVSKESEVRIRRHSVHWGKISNILFRGIKLTTDKEYISENKLSIPKWSFSRFKNVIFENCTSDDWGLISTTDSNGEVLGFNAFEDYEPRIYGRVPGNSEIVKIIKCEFKGGEKIDGVYQRQTQFAVRFYTEFNKDDGVYQLDSTLKNMLVVDSTFKGFNWQPIEFAGSGTRDGLVANSYFYDNGITWAEADKGAKNINFDNCYVDGLYGDVASESNQPRGISIQGTLNGNYMVKTKNIKMNNITVENIKRRGDAFHVGWIDGFTLRNIKVSFDRRYNYSNAFRLKPTVSGADVKDIKVENSYYGFYEDNLRREDYVDMGTFENIDLGNLIGFPISLYEGQVSNTKTNNRLKAHFKNIKGYTSLTDTSTIYTDDINNPHMIQIRGGGASYAITIEDFNVELSPANPNAGFGIFDIFEVRLINCSALRVPRFTKAGKVNDVTRLMISDCTEGIFNMQNVTPHLNNSAFLTSFPNTSGATPKGALYSDKKPTTTRVIPSQIVYNTNPVPGSYLGWTYISLSVGWKGFGLVES